MRLRNIVRAVLAVCLVAGLCFFVRQRLGSSHAQFRPAPSGAPAAAEAAPGPLRPGYPWGGALNSAREDGTFFFNRKTAREFCAAVEPELTRYVVELNSRAFLPLGGPAAASSVLAAAGQNTFQNKAVVYLQFYDHPQSAERQQLAQDGVELVAYVSGYTWLADGTPEALRAAMNEGFVRAEARIDPRDKLNAQVYGGTDCRGSRGQLH